MRAIMIWDQLGYCMKNSIKLKMLLLFVNFQKCWDIFAIFFDKLEVSLKLLELWLIRGVRMVLHGNIFEWNWIKHFLQNHFLHLFHKLFGCFQDISMRACEQILDSRINFWFAPNRRCLKFISFWQQIGCLLQ